MGIVLYYFIKTVTNEQQERKNILSLIRQLSGVVFWGESCTPCPPVKESGWVLSASPAGDKRFYGNFRLRKPAWGYYFTNLLVTIILNTMVFSRPSCFWTAIVDELQRVDDVESRRRLRSSSMSTLVETTVTRHVVSIAPSFQETWVRTELLRKSFTWTEMNVIECATNLIVTRNEFRS